MCFPIVTLLDHILQSLFFLSFIEALQLDVHPTQMHNLTQLARSMIRRGIFPGNGTQLDPDESDDFSDEEDESE